MCGISGIFSFSSFNVSPFIKEMTDIIKHRGPDDEGYYLANNDEFEFLKGLDSHPALNEIDDNFRPYKYINDSNQKAKLALGHRRLSIVDLSPHGHQPMSSANNRFVIVYNGEVYNYLELKKILEAKGYDFQSHSDTEVILKSYEEWGIKSLDKLNGMFSFIIYDRKKNSIFVARDRFGIKPLYYWICDGKYLAIASEIKQFTTLPGWIAKLNKQKAYDFLAYQLADHTNETLFDNVYQLRGGECFELNLNTDHIKIDIQQWYKLTSSPLEISFVDAKNKFKELFFDSIKLRLRADVSVGSALSGGLDSSSIVCTVNQFLRNENAHSLQNSFSACSRVKEVDEKKYIDIVKSHTNINAHYTYPEYNDLIHNLKKIIWYQDEPYGVTSVFAEWSVFALVKSTQVKVTLDGHGSDEILYGYHSFISHYLKDLLKKGKFIAFSNECIHLRKLDFRLRKLIFTSLYFMLPKGLKNLLKILLKGQSQNPSQWLNLELLNKNSLESYSDLNTSNADINEISKMQILYTSLPVQLHWADRDSMAHSIESRVPFLDYRLVEFVYNLPNDYKIDKGWTKKILRESMDSVIPNEIKNRTDKIGFATPESIWVQNEYPEYFKKEIRCAVDSLNDLFLPGLIKIADKIINGDNAYNSWVWRVIAFAKWMEVFSVRIN